MYVNIAPKPEVNQHSVLPASSLRVYESSLSTGTAPITTLTMIEPDCSLAAGTRLDRSQVLELVDALLSITEGSTLAEIRAEEYSAGQDHGYDDGNSDGYNDGYEVGFDRGYDAAGEVA